uniref:Uncharacterized protein n=1 Tax=Rhizophora mucronata TaxID=61149 RepID=A0A2P2J054_RHIMU
MKTLILSQETIKPKSLSCWVMSHNGSDIKL